MGWKVSKKLVWKLMDQLNLKSKVRIRRKYSSYKGKTSHIAENLLKRQFQTNVANTKWVSDVTEFRVAGRKLYLSPIMDLFDHCIISHTISTSPTTAFTSASLAEAFESQRPASRLLVHTDQGFHYQHSSWRHLLTKHGAVQSMSRKGNCFDNSVMENFFGHLKSEMYHGEHFATVADLTREINEYIDWYNNVRCQERLQGMAPSEYRCHTLAA